MVLSELSAQFAHDTAGAQVLTKAAALATGKIKNAIMQMDYSVTIPFLTDLEDVTKTIQFEPGYYFFLTSISAVSDGYHPFPLLGIQDYNNGKQLFATCKDNADNALKNLVGIQETMGPGSDTFGTFKTLTEPREYFYFFGDRGGVNVRMKAAPGAVSAGRNQMNVILTGWKISTKGLE